MGLFDTLEQFAGLEQSGGQTTVGGTTQQGAIGAVIQMLQAQPGGIAGVIQKFESAGFGGLAQSWLSTGSNQSVSPDQVQSALGAGPVGQVARQLGVSQDQAAGHIAQFLPLILAHLSPNGQAPSGSGFSELTGLLSRFTQAN
jgi:uncharacterized protein YidB (DUF937 family)